MAPSNNIISRQSISDGITDRQTDDGTWWYYSDTAFIIKWAVTAVIVGGLLLFFVGGYFHAQYRIKKNLPPLRYHKFLVPRRQREQFFPPSPRVYYHNTPYGHAPPMPLNNYGPPPPAYGENDYVPPYAPPAGGSKINPDQSYEHQHGYQSNPDSGPSQQQHPQSQPAAGVYR